MKQGLTNASESPINMISEDLLLNLISFFKIDDLAHFIQSSKTYCVRANCNEAWKAIFKQQQLAKYIVYDNKQTAKQNVVAGWYAKKTFAENLSRLFPPQQWETIPVLEFYKVFPNCKYNELTTMQKRILTQMKNYPIMRTHIHGRASLLLCVKHRVHENARATAKRYLAQISAEDRENISIEDFAGLELIIIFDKPAQNFRPDNFYNRGYSSLCASQRLRRNFYTDRRDFETSSVYLLYTQQASNTDIWSFLKPIEETKDVSGNYIKSLISNSDNIKMLTDQSEFEEMRRIIKDTDEYTLKLERNFKSCRFL